MKRLVIIKGILVLIFLVFLVQGGLRLYRHRHYDVPIVIGPGVTRVVRLSEFGPGIKGTMADTWVYILEGNEPGGKALLMANTHANEPEGLLAAVAILENAVVEKGTLIIIPMFNHSAGRNTLGRPRNRERHGQTPVERRPCTVRGERPRRAVEPPTDGETSGLDSVAGADVRDDHPGAIDLVSVDHSVLGSPRSGPLTPPTVQDAIKICRSVPSPVKADDDVIQHDARELRPATQQGRHDRLQVRAGDFEKRPPRLRVLHHQPRHREVAEVSQADTLDVDARVEGALKRLHAHTPDDSLQDERHADQVRRRERRHEDAQPAHRTPQARRPTTAKNF